MPEPKPTQSPISEPVEPKFREVLSKVVEESLQWGIEKYGTPLMTFNGRSELRDMAEELVSGLRYAVQLDMRCQVLTETLRQHFARHVKDYGENCQCELCQNTDLILRG